MEKEMTLQEGDRNVNDLWITASTEFLPELKKKKAFFLYYAGLGVEGNRIIVYMRERLTQDELEAFHVPMQWQEIPIVYKPVQSAIGLPVGTR